MNYVRVRVCDVCMHVCVYVCMYAYVWKGQSIGHGQIFLFCMCAIMCVIVCVCVCMCTKLCVSTIFCPIS